MAIPVIQSIGTGFIAVDADTLTISAPAGIVSGDLLVLAISNDYSLADTDIINPITGWTKVATGGDSTTDVQLAVFWRISDGTEGASVDSTFSAITKACGQYLRIIGANTTQFDNDGTVFLKTATTSNIVTPGITTNSADTLAINFVATDGSDNLPFSANTVGWTKYAELASESLGQGCSQSLVTQEFPSAGATGDSLVNYATSDGAVGVQFAIASGAAGGSPINTILNNLLSSNGSI